MDNLKFTLEPYQRQESCLPSSSSQHSIGLKIVRSAPCVRKHCYRFRPARSINSKSELSPRDRIITLCGQLTLLRKRLQAGLPVTADCVMRAERLARTLEAEVAA